nr:phosphatase PAP2 family protein [Streptomyces sp. A1547]
MRSGANHNSRGMASARAARSSFPSGHAAAAVAFAAAVAPSWPLAAAACAVPTLLVGLERIHAGAHHPSDVAAGAVIGLASAPPRPRGATPAAERIGRHVGRSGAPRLGGEGCAWAPVVPAGDADRGVR